MKLRVVAIDWEYPSDGHVPKPELWNLETATRNDLMGYYLGFANGIYLELRAEGDCDEAVEVLKGLILGAGSGRLVETLSDGEKARLWLYRDRYDCYVQGDPPCGWFFVDPTPRPELFEKG